MVYFLLSSWFTNATCPALKHKAALLDCHASSRVTLVLPTDGDGDDMGIKGLTALITEHAPKAFKVRLMTGALSVY